MRVTALDLMLSGWQRILVDNKTVWTFISQSAPEKGVAFKEAAKLYKQGVKES